MATTTTTTTTTPRPTDEEMITQMYDAALASQTAQLEQARDQGLADIQAEQERLQQQTDANLNRTYVEAARDQRNYAEVQNAYGLSSGAMAQARLAQDNQLEADLTALRNAQTTIDANIERERTALSQQYAAAIAQAQAENDLQKAQALYQEAKEAEEQLRQDQLDAGKLMAAAGDYSILANLYGLTPEQVAILEGESGGNTATGTTPGPSTNPNPAPGPDQSTGYGQVVVNGTNLVISPKAKDAYLAAMEAATEANGGDPLNNYQVQSILQGLQRDGDLSYDEYLMLSNQYQ